MMDNRMSVTGVMLPPNHISNYSLMPFMRQEGYILPMRYRLDLVSCLLSYSPAKGLLSDLLVMVCHDLRALCVHGC